MSTLASPTPSARHYPHRAHALPFPLADTVAGAHRALVRAPLRTSKTDPSMPVPPRLPASHTLPRPPATASADHDHDLPLGRRLSASSIHPPLLQPPFNSPTTSAPNTPRATADRGKSRAAPARDACLAKRYRPSPAPIPPLAPVSPSSPSSATATATAIGTGAPADPVSGAAAVSTDTASSTSTTTATSTCADSSSASTEVMPPTPRRTVSARASAHQRHASETAATAAAAARAHHRQLSADGPPPRGPPPLKAADLRVGRVLGSGGTATVLRAELPATHGGCEIALKVIQKKALSRRAQHYLAREVAIHRAVSAHPHVVSLLDVFEDASAVYLVQELLRGGDLYAALRRERGGVGERVALRIAVQVVHALKFMHARGFAHRDIKPENVMFAERPCLRSGRVGAVKLIDFGLACARNPRLAVRERTSSEKCGTVRYAAPEIVTDGSYVPERADMWSVGVVLYSMIAHRNPYTGRSEREVVAAVDAAAPLFDGPEWEGVSAATRDAIAALLRRRPGDRPCASRCLDMLVGALRALEEGGGGEADSGRACRDGESFDEETDGGAASGGFDSGATTVRGDGSGSGGRDGEDGWTAPNLLHGLRALFSGGEREKEKERERGGSSSP